MTSGTVPTIPAETSLHGRSNNFPAQKGRQPSERVRQSAKPQFNGPETMHVIAFTRFRRWACAAYLLVLSRRLSVMSLIVWIQ